MNETKERVEIGLNCLLIAACLVFIWSLATNQWKHWQNSPKGLQYSLRGKMLASPPGYKWPDTGALIVGLREGCVYCKESLPFYKRISEEEKSGRLRTPALTIMPDDAVSGKILLDEGGVALTHLYDIPLQSMRISATPTLILVDSKGEVKNAWVGELSKDQEMSVLRTIEK